MKAGRIKQWAAGLVAAALPVLAFAQDSSSYYEPHADRWQLNMKPGVTLISENAYEAHMIALWICVGIGVLVFGAMAVAIFKFRKSRGAVADTSFTHSTKLEIIWTAIPVALLVALAFPATSKLLTIYDVRDAEMTVKVTGYQWMWTYEYLDSDVRVDSRLARRSDDIRQAGTVPYTRDEPNYLLEVTRELVLPTDTKIRFVITADDVIHSWWVPALGWKQDAIPGLINEAWTEIRKPGVYRGQCAELCGKDHAFMPIVVRAVPPAEFREWLATNQGASRPVAPLPGSPAEPYDEAPAKVPGEIPDDAEPDADLPTQPVAPAVAG